MSGIIVTINKDTEPVDESHLKELLTKLEHRGGDTFNVRCIENVGIGYVGMYTVPEEVGEVQPIHHNGISVVVDGRIDNRDSLLEEIKQAEGEVSDELSDAQIILRSYSLWGEDFLERVVGVFVIVIWDSLKNRLLCARDRTGVRNIYLYDSPDQLCLSSEVSPLLHNSIADPELNASVIAEFAVHNHQRIGETFYKGINYVPPATCVKYDGDELLSTTYWNLAEYEGRREDISESEIVREFQALFKECILSRMRSITSPGVMMSGGLDSTAIAGVLNKETTDEVSTYSLVSNALEESNPTDPNYTFPKRERECIQSMTDIRGIEEKLINIDEYWTLKDVNAYTPQRLESPRFNALRLVNSEAHNAAANAGTNVLLLGDGGNLFDGSRIYYADLIQNRDISALLEHIDIDSISNEYLLKWYGLAPHLPDVFSVGVDLDADSDWPSWVNNSFIREHLSAEDNDRDKFHYYENKRNFGLLTDPERTFAYDMEQQAALRQGIELRFPLLDSRIIEFLFSLPPGMRYRAGSEKYLFKKAMEDVLPKEVLSQDHTFIFDPLINHGLAREQEKVERLLSNGNIINNSFSDESELMEFIESYYRGEVDAMAFWRIISLELFLSAARAR